MSMQYRYITILLLTILLHTAIIDTSNKDRCLSGSKPDRHHKQKEMVVPMLNRNSITLPPFAVLTEAAAELVKTHAADKPRTNAINKALWNLAHGIEIIPVSGGFLMPSGTRAGII